MLLPPLCTPAAAARSNKRTSSASEAKGENLLCALALAESVLVPPPLRLLLQLPLLQRQGRIFFFSFEETEAKSREARFFLVELKQL